MNCLLFHSPRITTIVTILLSVSLLSACGSDEDDNQGNHPSQSQTDNQSWANQSASNDSTGNDNDSTGNDTDNSSEQSSWPRYPWDAMYEVVADEFPDNDCEELTDRSRGDYFKIVGTNLDSYGMNYFVHWCDSPAPDDCSQDNLFIALDAEERNTHLEEGAVPGIIHHNEDIASAGHGGTDECQILGRIWEWELSEDGFSYHETEQRFTFDRTVESWDCATYTGFPEEAEHLIECLSRDAFRGVRMD